MACCKCCCGGENCAEGQQGKCCCGGPSGTCCQSGEYCCSGACQSSPCAGGACCDPYGTGCYVTTQYDCWGTWKGAGTTCTPNPCVECTQHSDCPEGKYCCKGLCADEPCPSCEGHAYPGCNIGYSTCGSGESPESGSPCDPSLPDQPSSPPFNCLGGGPTSVTVTGAGYAYPATPSDPGFKTFIDNAMNNSYAVTFAPNCNYGGDATFPITHDGANYVVFVIAGVKYAVIGVKPASNLSGPWTAIMETNLGMGDPTFSSCGTALYDCSGFSGTSGSGTLTVS